VLVAGAAVALEGAGLLELAAPAILFEVGVGAEAEAAAELRPASEVALEWEGAVVHGAIATELGVGAD
jgi:hypothetical protein